MTTATKPSTSTKRGDVSAAVPQCVSARSWEEAVQSAAAYLATTTGPVLAIARAEAEAVALTPVGGQIPEEIHDSLGRVAAQVFTSPQGWVCTSGAFAVRGLADAAIHARNEALIGVTTSDPVPAHLMLVSAALSAVIAREAAGASVQEAETAGRLIDIADRLHEAIDERDLFRRLATSVRQMLEAESVAIGRRQAGRFEFACCEPAEFIAAEDDEAVVAAAFDEAHVHGEPIVWPPIRSLDRPARRAIERAATLHDGSPCWMLPLTNGRGQVDTVIAVWGPGVEESLVQVAAYWNPTLGATIDIVRNAQATAWQRLKSSIAEAVWGRALRLTIGVLATAGAILAMPLPYRPLCECRLEPFERRFVAAPFASTLKEAVVEPGDVVEAGSLLAELDEREIEWELAGLEAELRQAAKRRNAALAEGSLAEAQIAEFEGERLAARRDLLTSRRGQLGLRAPIAGIVVEGDLVRAEGMPLEFGQSLFEVAPLNEFVCELHIPEFDVHDVQVGQSVSISLDSRPGETLVGQVSRVRPRAETWKDAVGFVAEVRIPNHDGSLRPGMTGEARVRAGVHPLGRNLLHRAYGQWRRGW